MASYHFSVKTINRRSGRSTVAAAAYRAGARLCNETDNSIHDFSRRHGVLASFIMAPADAPAWVYDRQELWNQVETKEKRQDSRTAREFVIALPLEIGDAAREALVRQFVARLQAEFPGVYDVAIHRPDGSANYHAHVLGSTRAITPTGFGAKFTALDDPKTSGAVIERLRADFAAMQNAALEAARVADRVDHRSHAKRGLSVVPGWHHGPVRTAIARRQEALERAARAARHLAARIRLPSLARRPVAPVLGQSAGWLRRRSEAAVDTPLRPAMAMRLSPAPAAPALSSKPAATAAASPLMASIKRAIAGRTQAVSRPVFRPTVMPVPSAHSAYPWSVESDRGTAAGADAESEPTPWA